MVASLNIGLLNQTKPKQTNKNNHTQDTQVPFHICHLYHWTAAQSGQSSCELRMELTVQTDVFSKFRGVTLIHRPLTQSFQLCFSNAETAGAYLSREKSFWKATKWVEGERRAAIFFSHFSRTCLFTQVFHSGPTSKMLFTCLWNNSCWIGSSLVSRLVHIHSWDISLKISTNFEPHERNSHGGLGNHWPQESLVLSQNTVCSLYYII